MPDTCTICETIRPQGGTHHLVLNEGKMWLEFCKRCGETTKLKNEETNEEKTIAELYAEAESSCDAEAQEDDQFNSDAEADADTLSSAGFGTDEDYGGGTEQL